MSQHGHSNGFAGAMVHAPLAKALPQVDPSRAFEPGSIEEGYRLAGLLVKSRLLPADLNTPEAAFAVIATGRELGLTAMQSIRSIHVIKGRTTLSADLVAALVKSRSDVCRYFMLVESTDVVARYETQRVGEPKPTTMAFTIEDAKRAGLAGGDNWRKYPAAMLRARCITALARAVYPDLAMGIYDPDELQEAPAPEAPRVYVEAEPAASPDGTAFAALAERVDHAETAAELNLVAKDCMAARRAGAIVDTQVDLIASGVKAKRAILGAPAPPKSEPQVQDHDGETGEVA